MLVVSRYVIARTEVQLGETLLLNLVVSLPQRRVEIWVLTRMFVLVGTVRLALEFLPDLLQQIRQPIPRRWHGWNSAMCVIHVADCTPYCCRYCG